MPIFFWLPYIIFSGLLSDLSSAAQEPRKRVEARVTRR
jgi:hypothetical protein